MNRDETKTEGHPSSLLRETFFTSHGLETVGEAMKKAMSGFDLRAMARELDDMKGAYVKKAYMPHYEQIVLRINPKEA